MKSTSRFTFFFGRADPFSNWHPCRFVVRGIEFGCVEQYMMFAKAKLFGDEHSAALVLAARAPAEQKALGRRVSGFDEAVWEARREGIVLAGLRAKYGQNPGLRAALLATLGTALAEASPYGRVWGIGVSADDPRAECPDCWPGQNSLGRLHERVRAELQQEALHLGP